MNWRLIGAIVIILGSGLVGIAVVVVLEGLL